MANHVPNVVGQKAGEPSLRDIAKDNLRQNFDRFHIEKRRSWGPILVDIVDRAAGQATCRANCHRLTYFLTDFQATMEDDERPEWECQLLRGNFVFRPPDTRLRRNLSAGRYIQIVQSRNTYANLALEMVRGGAADLVPKYNLHDPLISQIVSTLANELD